jgi:uracil-DNA glycosylase family 4
VATRLQLLERDIVDCELCPRLREYCAEVATVKRRAYREEAYWGRPVPGFGDPQARLFVIGLAPGAHGANRTGRVFTGDRSGDWLYRALHQCGFANQPRSSHRRDGLTLQDAWVSASVRCAPPGNKPSRDEILTCRAYLERELTLFPKVRAVVALGRLAFDNYLDLLKSQGRLDSRAVFQFGHGAEHPLSPVLISSYHPSQQNTQTGKLTEPMLRGVFVRARRILEGAQ